MKDILSQVRTANISVKVEPLQRLWYVPTILPTHAAPRWLSLPAKATSFSDKPAVKMTMSHNHIYKCISNFSYHPSEHWLLLLLPQPQTKKEKSSN